MRKLNYTKEEAIRYLSEFGHLPDLSFGTRKTANYRGWREENETFSDQPNAADPTKLVYYDPKATRLPYNTHPLTGTWIMIGRDSFNGKVDTSLVKIVWVLRPSGEFTELRQVGMIQQEKHGYWSCIDDFSQQPTLTITLDDPVVGIYNNTKAASNEAARRKSIRFLVSWFEGYGAFTIITTEYEQPHSYWSRRL